MSNKYKKSQDDDKNRNNGHSNVNKPFFMDYKSAWFWPKWIGLAAFFIIIIIITCILLFYDSKQQPPLPS